MPSIDSMILCDNEPLRRNVTKTLCQQTLCSVLSETKTHLICYNILFNIFSNKVWSKILYVNLYKYLGNGVKKLVQRRLGKFVQN